MARNVNFDLDPHRLEACLESPVDEVGLHNSFSQLLMEEESQEAIELLERQNELDEEERDRVDDLSSPDEEIWRRREDVEGEEEGRRLLDLPTEERWSSATLRVLSSMPSRTIGRSRGAIISQYYNRTMQLRRRRQSKPSAGHFSRSARPSICGYGVETDDVTDGDRNKRDHLVNNLQNLPASDRVRMLRAMPLSVAEKNDLRLCSSPRFPVRFNPPSPLHQVALKKVSGRFGTGVLSYFLFVKTLLFFNLFLFLVTGLFLALPQAIHPPSVPPGRVSFSGLELLTGGGYFSESVMYYGYYSNYTVTRNCSSSNSSLSYNIPLAYFFTIGMAFFITCIILVYRYKHTHTHTQILLMSKSFGRSFRIDKSHGILAMKVFCSWDFKVIKKASVKLRSENISTQLKELLAETNQKPGQKSVCQKAGRVTVHGVAWLICVGGVLGCVLAIHFFSEHIPLVTEASLLALPVVVSLFNLLLPGLFNAAAWMEEYDSPSVRAYVSISRNLMLKTSVLGVLCYRWLGRIAAEPEKVGLNCWETFVGQELYRFLLMDFIFTILDTFFGEFLWRLFSQKALKRKRKPVFDIARNVLELIYGQTLAWLGVLFSPLLPAVQIIKLLLLFYIKQASVMMNCQSPRKPYRASQMTTIFITLLCFPSFLGAAVCVTYTMWSIRPSLSCGPFRSLANMCQSGKLWVQELESHNPNLSWLTWAHSYLVENPLFLFLAAGAFMIVIYFHSQVVDGQRKIISLLQEQIENVCSVSCRIYTTDVDVRTWPTVAAQRPAGWPIPLHSFTSGLPLAPPISLSPSVPLSLPPSRSPPLSPSRSPPPPL
uniref:Transmembrane channel-like protein n=1 Tax=Esox lucius TaxID=8010 RepID=A0A3P8YRI5_ESOLU